MKNKLKEKLQTLPESPGCYIYRDKNGDILYIGKSKNLKKRVKSYFTKTQSGKTARLVHHIVDFELILTDSEQEALLLEMTLIMKYQPPYNVMLKEEIRYLYIKITNEQNPHLELTKEIENDGGHYFGPYASRYMATETLELIQKLYPLCHCSGKKGRPCFYYHLGMCIGPCARNVSPEEYNDQIKKIKQFLNGGQKAVKREIKERMQNQMEALEFERAKETHALLNILDRVTEKQKVITRDFGHRDIVHFVGSDNYCAVQIFFVRNGAIVGRTAKVFEYTGELSEVVESYLVQFYMHPNHLEPKELLIPDTLDPTLLAKTLDIKVRVPKKGEKKALLELVHENAKSALEAHFKMITYKSKVSE
ncbi:excinuclease ABC subunit C [Listeria fleischmannii 1991]|uniref:Excinuclease ABC subunit C n=2 Tax=Listeria fleischmannii TaxID=1069827 RepID=A0A2X3GV94_9LIST|nr:excinuclease ABC subunit UvrC [Listeria fleischmannii]KMT59299.1 excinuclease ABC subunit C [Listeria fleischmannii 1991]SQC72278.1 Excinuclease ABC subunit C [Listeria fleischmannii subsp. fleischmannii]